MRQSSTALKLSRPSPTGAAFVPHSTALTVLRAMLVVMHVQSILIGLISKPQETTMKNEITIHLPEEFIELCKQDEVEPETVLRGFIADLAEIMNWVSNPREDNYCSDERRMARDYYDRVGYPYWHQ